MTRQSAVLPEQYMTPQIWNMRVGAHGYLPPWRMWVDLKRQCWLPLHDIVRDRSHDIIRDRSHGTAAMRVERRDDGYHVWLPPGETWQPQDSTHIGMPIAEIHTEPYEEK